MMFWKFIVITSIILTVLFPSNIDRGDSENMKYKNPAIAWKLSLVPGLGQIYNEQYLKSCFFILSEVYAISQIKKYSDVIKMRNKFSWWFIGLYFINIIDAYVDAELSTFPKNNVNQNKDK